MALHDPARDRQIRAWWKQGLSQAEIARRLRVSGPRAGQILRRLGEKSTSPLRHGYAGYVNHVCRCEKCRAGWAEYCDCLRFKRAEREVPLHLHGRSETYHNYRCRCRPCTDAATEYKRTRR